MIDFKCIQQIPQPTGIIIVAPETSAFNSTALANIATYKLHTVLLVPLFGLKPMPFSAKNFFKVPVLRFSARLLKYPKKNPNKNQVGKLNIVMYIYIYIHLGVSEIFGTPKSSHFNRDFHYKPYILGYPYFWKPPYTHIKCVVLHQSEQFHGTRRLVSFEPSF